MKPLTTNEVLYEIGLEEMPARFLAATETQLQQKTEKWLADHRLEFHAVKVFVTPRRMAVRIEQLANKQQDLEEEIKGPARKIALDQDGNWTKAAIGFTKGQGVSVEDIYFKTIKDVEYIYVKKFISGKATPDILPSFRDVILSLTFPKNMRWSTRTLRFIRPIKWLVGLYGTDLISFEIEGVKSGRTSFGHRFLGKSISIPEASLYEDLLKNQYVIVDSKVRKQQIVNQINQLATNQEWSIPIDQELLEEVTQLVEYPTVFYGQFSKDYLAVPDEALITSMKEHQRYFPVRDQNKRLLPFFVSVRNGNTDHLDIVSRGNEKVLNARLADAVFFYQEDQKQSIDAYNKKLSRMVFQDKLGTIADKVDRVTQIANKLAILLNLTDSEQVQVQRAAQISKFDLVTLMVNEFTNLQGIMGEKYAILAGEDPEVAVAINEHYMPRHAHDQLPKTTIGAIVSVADKLDTIIGCIGVGLVPSGSQDPYGLRRQAMGVIQIINDQNWSVRIEQLLDIVLELYQQSTVEMESPDKVIAQFEQFIKARIIYLAKEQQIGTDIIEAILSQGLGKLSDVMKKAALLEAKRTDPNFKPIQEALIRVLNLAKKGEQEAVNQDLFENETEQQLYNAYQEITPDYLNCIETGQFEESLDILGQLAPSIVAFFDQTMVMADDLAVRANRLALLKQLGDLVDHFASFDKIEWKQQF